VPSIWYRLYRDAPPTASSSSSAESQSAAAESSSHGPWRRLNRDTCTVLRPSDIEIRPVFEVADFGEAGAIGTARCADYGGRTTITSTLPFALEAGPIRGRLLAEHKVIGLLTGRITLSLLRAPLAAWISGVARRRQE
jgi:hypothetical protein